MEDFDNEFQNEFDEFNDTIEVEDEGNYEYFRWDNWVKYECELFWGESSQLSLIWFLRRNRRKFLSKKRSLYFTRATYIIKRVT